MRVKCINDSNLINPQNSTLLTIGKWYDLLEVETDYNSIEPFSSSIREKIVAIAIFNVRKEECNSINTILDGLKVQVDELIGFDLQYSVEEYSDVFSDYTIRLV